MGSLRFLNISELSNLIKKKEISPTEILKNTIEDIDKLESKINSFAFKDIEGAKKLALESEKRMLSNSLLSEIDGIPTSIKDLIAQKHLPLRFGSLVGLISFLFIKLIRFYKNKKNVQFKIKEKTF